MENLQISSRVWKSIVSILLLIFSLKTLDRVTFEGQISKRNFSILLFFSDIWIDARSINNDRKSSITKWTLSLYSGQRPNYPLTPSSSLCSPRSSRWLETKRYQLEEKKVERLSRLLFTVFQWFTPCVINPAASVCEARASYGAVCQNHACITIPLFGVPFPLPRDPLRDI